MLGDQVGEQFADLVHRDDRRVDSNALLVGDVAAQLVLMLAPGDLQKARSLEPTIPAHTFLPAAEIQLITFKGQLGFGGKIIVHADQSAGMAGRARGSNPAFEDGSLQSALSKVKGNARSHHTGADDDCIVCLVHNGFLVLPAPSPAQDFSITIKSKQRTFFTRRRGQRLEQNGNIPGSIPPSSDHFCYDTQLTVYFKHGT